MTLHDTVLQLHKLSVSGYFNRENFSVSRLESQIASLFRGEPDKRQVVMEISLPDGWWWFTVNQYRPGEFDYTIPDTREESDAILERLLH